MIQFQEIEGDCVIWGGFSLDTFVTMSKMVPVDDSGAKDTDQSQTDVDLVVCFT